MEYRDVQQINVHFFDTSNKDEMFLLEYQGCYFEVNIKVAKLVNTLKSADSIESGCERFSIETGRKYSKEDVKKIIEKYLSPILDTNNKKKAKQFLFKIELLSAKNIRSFSSLLKIFFIPVVSLTLLGCVLIFEILFFCYNDVRIYLGEMDFYTVCGVFCLFLFSSFFHELGHASACKAFNVEHGGVGFGLYLNFPVFYTDVSNAWVLSRKKRIIINLAGVYFQLLFLLPLFIVYFINGSPVLKYIIFTVNLNFLITLNPFFKFDGYWVMSDLLGVPNLRKRTQEFFAYYLKKFKRGKGLEKPFLLSICPLERNVMLIYTLTVNLFFVYYFCYLLPRMLVLLFDSFPGLLQQLINSLAMGYIPSAALVQKIFIQLIFLGITIYFLMRVFKPFILKMVCGIKSKKHNVVAKI